MSDVQEPVGEDGLTDSQRAKLAKYGKLGNNKPNSTAAFQQKQKAPRTHFDSAEHELNKQSILPPGQRPPMQPQETTHQ